MTSMTAYSPVNTAMSSQYQKTMIGMPGQMSSTRRYDMCMVFKYKTNKKYNFDENDQESTEGMIRRLEKPPDQEKKRMEAWKQRREALLKQMKNCGLNIFCFYNRDRDEVFCKIGADAEKLCITAARMKYKLQLKPEYLSAYAEYRQDFKGRGDRDGKDRRHYSQMYERHVGADEVADESSIFTTRDKINIIHHCIVSKDKDCAGINIAQLMTKEHEEILQNYFPLHEKSKLDEIRGAQLSRKEYIAHMWHWLTMPKEHSENVRAYFGDKVAFYYLWMSFYWKWLVIPGVIGAALQVLDVVFHSPDNPTAIPFCLFLSVWTLFLPHFWRRQEAKYAISWGTFDMVAELEPARPEHTGEPRINPVTAQVENYFPWHQRMRRYMCSITVIIVTGIALGVFILTLLVFRHFEKDTTPGGIAMWQFAIALIVEVNNYGLSRVAQRLTRDENHRTQSEHDIHLLAKVFAFKFVNSYFVLYYIAFFKTKTVLPPWINFIFRGTEEPVQEQCIKGRFSGHHDCLLDLQLALAMFMIVRLLVQNFSEFLCPKLKTKFRSGRTEFMNWWRNLLNPVDRLEQADMSQAEQEAKREPYDPFTDFDETLVTHGYATLFAVTSPWVTFATLIWIMVETLLDVKNLTENTQRPLPLKMRSNEPWDTAFDIYGVLAAITNLLLLIFASKQYSDWSFTIKLCLFIVFFHAIVLAKIVLMALFPVVPRSVNLLNLKQANMVHRCLENIKVEPQQDFSLFRQHGADNFEIMEQDVFDDEDTEPTFGWYQFKNSMSVLNQDLRKVLDVGTVTILVVTILLTFGCAMCLLLWHASHGGAHSLLGNALR